MLRAVRFAATYEFSIEDATHDAIRQLRQYLVQVSPERIAQELRRMLAHRTRAVSVNNLAIVGLLEVILPRIFGPEADGDSCVTIASVDRICNKLRHLNEETFEPALALLLESQFVPKAASLKSRTAAVRQECRGLRLSNEETDCVCWLLASAAECFNVSDLPLHRVKPLLADRRSPLLLDLLNAVAVGEDREPVDAAFLREYLIRVPGEILNPRPFVDGADLKSLGLKAGPVFKELLTTLRNEQLDEQICNRQDALDRLRELSTAEKA